MASHVFLTQMSVNTAELLAHLITCHRPPIPHRGDPNNLVKRVAPDFTNRVVPGFDKSRNTGKPDKRHLTLVGLPIGRSNKSGQVVDYVAVNGRHGQTTPVAQPMPHTTIVQPDRLKWLAIREQASGRNPDIKLGVAHAPIVLPNAEAAALLAGATTGCVIANVERIEADEEVGEVA